MLSVANERRLEAQYADYRKALESVFSDICLDSTFKPDGYAGPYVILPPPHNGHDLTIEEHQQKTIEKLDGHVDSLIRMQEYIMGRLLTEDENIRIQRHKEAIIDRIKNPMGEFSTDYDAACTLPLSLYTSERLRRWEEFAAGFKETASPAEGAHYRVNPDEAALALTAWTGVPWHIVLAKPGGYIQLRLETENDIENSAAVAQIMDEVLRGAKKMVFPLGNRLFMPASMVTPLQLDRMRTDGLHPAIGALTRKETSASVRT